MIELIKRLEFTFLLLLRIIKFKHIWKKSLVKYWTYTWSNHIYIWDYVYIWDNALFAGEWWINIWDWSILWPRVTIRSTNHNYKNSSLLPYDSKIIKKQVYIWKNCWIWDNVMISPWTHLWEWCIVWMWSVLSWIYESNCLIIWNPGKIIKELDKTQYTEKKKEGLIYLKHKNNSLLSRLKKYIKSIHE